MEAMEEAMAVEPNHNIKTNKKEDKNKTEPGSSNTVASREYQLELFEKAKNNNIIICLPTGSGKTWIAFLLIKHYYAECIEEGKKIIFLANQVSLVKQQYRYLAEHLAVDRIQYYTGDKNVDFWSSTVWQNELNQNDVLVMSAEIFRKILNQEIEFNKVALLVLDECHHATKNHSMKKIMDVYNQMSLVPNYKLPRVLGLTACVAKSSKAGERGFVKQMFNLECTLNSRAVTSTQYEQVLLHSTNAKIKTAVFDGYMMDETFLSLDRVVPQLNAFIIKPEEHPVIRQILRNHGVKNSRRFDVQRDFIRVLLGNIDSIEQLYLTLGPFCANVGINILMREKLDAKAMAPFKRVATAIIGVYRTWLVEMQTILILAMKNGREAYSPKVKCLFAQLLKKTEKSRDRLRAIVFIQKRLDCQVLYTLAAELSQQCPETWGFMRSNFVIGARTDMTVDNVSSSHALQERTLNGFRMNQYNVIFSTSVLEEGLDVPACNLIIRFDKINIYQSFVQSMGRARSKHSARFVIFVNKEVAAQEIQEIKNFMIFTGDCVRGLIKNADCIGYDVGRDIEPDELEPLCPGGTPTSPKLTSYDAIATVYQYCNTLPTYSKDMREANQPVGWWYEQRLKPGEFLDPRKKDSCHYQGFLVLPRKSVYTEKITGPVMTSKKAAKRGVFLEACKKLYEGGALDENLRPIKISLLPTILRQFETTPPISTDGFKNWYKSTVPQKFDHQASPGSLYILYKLEIALVTTTGNPRERMYDYADRKYCTGLLSVESLDMIPPFKLLSRLGTMTVELVNLSHVVNPLRLSPVEYRQLKRYQQNLFSDLLGLGKLLNLMNQIDYSPLLVVPICKESEELYFIDFEIMAELEAEYVCGGLLHPKYACPVTETQRTLPEHNDRFIEKGGYSDAVIIPWCCADGELEDRMYCVLQVTNDTEESNIDCFNISPKAGKNKSFKTYFETKFTIKLTYSGQRLIECHKMKKSLEFLKQEKQTGKRSENKKFLKYIPELVRTFSLPASLFTQARFLPTILHRISRFLIAMELGQKISSDPDKALRRPTYTVADKWAFNEIVGEPDYLNCNTNQDPTTTIEFGPSNGARFIFSKETSNCMTTPSCEPIPSRRKRPRLEPLESMNSNSNALRLTKWGSRAEVMDTNAYPPIYELLEAITLSGAHDRLDLQRLEVIGDSFLKYSVTLAIYGMFQGCDEGHLTQIRSKVVSNQNLKRLGDIKGIGGMLAGGIFSTHLSHFTFLPPSFVPNEELVRAGMKTGYELDVFKDLSLGIQETTKEYLTAYAKEKGAQPGRLGGYTMGYSKLREKDVADCVEAVIGAYYLAGGESSALHVMDWFGIKCPDKDGELVVIGQAEQEFYTWPTKDRSHTSPRKFVPAMANLEKVLKYTFKNPWLLVEALTHPNDTENRMTEAFERLEFLGDAVLDFVITRHIYNNFLAEEPGQITDLRSALVNNVTLGSLAVKYGFHKHLLQSSRILGGMIDKVVRMQEANGYKVMGQGHFQILPEYETMTAEDVEVPKVLGDIFESLCGAIFVDTNGDLERTWEVFYRLMKTEIDLFAVSTPKAPVREVSERQWKTELGISKNGMSEYTIKTKFGEFKGLGSNKKSAKEAAAKLALYATAQQKTLTDLNGLSI